jgi:hypothetical protein
MANGNDTGDIAFAREVTQTMQEPVADALYVKRLVTRGPRARFVGTQLTRNKFATRVPQADLGVGFADIDNDRPAFDDRDSPAAPCERK